MNNLFVILWVNWCKNNSFWQRFTCTDKVPLPEDKKREIMDREKVWVPDPDEGFVLGQIVDLTEEGALVQPLARSKKPIEASFDRLYPTEDNDTKGQLISE